jgi:hypothetical protein
VKSGLANANSKAIRNSRDTELSWPKGSLLIAIGSELPLEPDR